MLLKEKKNNNYIKKRFKNFIRAYGSYGYGEEFNNANAYGHGPYDADAHVYVLDSRLLVYLRNVIS